ncbi:hypothetical protein FRB94_004348 [Tulasnella sp. JGI-2019a]|nr:hypothetical protein FRB93_000349 [Tulasnella sp. JGI-2019a]KAG9015229.1 hypothetical protein FRB94_004348 [Tulasnella sp. JGI-2019a]KAG9039298.1 hypothetical protein FRB95_011883 [Tulasnella sp. JGI-2019a]
MNFYRTAAGIIDQLDTKKGSIKSCLTSVDEKQRKRTAALVIETLKYRPSLVEVINATPLLTAEKKLLSLNLSLVLVHDLLLAKGGIQAKDGPVKQAVVRHKTRLQAEWVKLKIKSGAKSNVDLAQPGDPRADNIPRYVRVNRNLCTMEDAIAALEKEGHVRVESGEELQGKVYAVDPHIRDLLQFPSITAFHEDLLYKSGKVILQDKASCFPATVLAPPLGGTVIDATSAPGNKTSHLSALMENSGKIFAFERDRRRFETLKVMVAKAGCKNVEPVLVDFLQINPKESTYKAVSHILLDPSCSGSGIVNRLDYLVETEDDDGAKEDRLQKLSAFQLSMIRHAMKFPSVSKIVYSTCSVHPEEDEHVVRDALASLEGKGFFGLAPRSLVLPEWPRRGLAGGLGTLDTESVLRCSPGQDATNGFFVACFVRVGSGFDTPAGKVTRGEVLLVKRRATDNDEAPYTFSESHSEGGGDAGTTRKRKRKRAKKSKVVAAPDDADEWSGIASQ